jgi:hypothetical protein
MKRGNPPFFVANVQADAYGSTSGGVKTAAFGAFNAQRSQARRF